MKRQFHKQIILLFFLLLSNTIIGYSLPCCNHCENEIDSCCVDRLKTTIVEFINGENKNVYGDDFLLTLKKNKTAAGACYFPGANDIAMFWSFIENTLVKESENDKRALSLLIDLNIAYKNNAELSGELFTQAINKVALQCLECFISELSLRSDQEIDYTILRLDYLNDDEAKIILDQLNAVRKPEYQYIVERIKNILNN